MVYAATTGVIICWNLEHTFVIHINNHAWLDENNYCISIEDKRNTGSLMLQKYPESNIYNSDLLNLIPCELDLTSTPFCDTKILTYEIELPPSKNIIGFKLLDN